jgi:hypothetical protein
MGISIFCFFFLVANFQTVMTKQFGELCFLNANSKRIAKILKVLPNFQNNKIENKVHK